MSKDNLTQYSIEELKCPKCGHAHHLKKYSVINVTEKPAMKEDILKNRIFNFDCENCDLVAPLTYESMYLDSKKKLLICLSTEETDMGQFEEWERKKGMTLRVVDNINDLKEKIMIAENLLDDRVVEMVKIAYLRRLEKEGFTVTTDSTPVVNSRAETRSSPSASTSKVTRMRAAPAAIGGMPRSSKRASERHASTTSRSPCST